MSEGAGHGLGGHTVDLIDGRLSRYLRLVRFWLVFLYLGMGWLGLPSGLGTIPRFLITTALFPAGEPRVTPGPSKQLGFSLRNSLLGHSALPSEH